LLAGYAPRWKFVAFDVGPGYAGCFSRLYPSVAGRLLVGLKTDPDFMKVSVFLYAQTHLKQSVEIEI
jgi:hypothetical protein